ncbi:MAG: serine/threonine protein kinase [Symploca sp. SIO2C1]|nr:serine/threonine protein kinase [Symploca sp. SIO2C1]
MRLSRPFLVNIAHEHQLSPDQEEVFLLRFASEMEYEQIAHQLKTSRGACGKRMSEIYKKFDITGGTRGKETQLRNLLTNKYQYQQTGEISASTSVLLNHQPLPAFPGSPLDINSPFYIKRPPIEDYCSQQILQPGSLIRIKAPQQMGKTSLMLRILHQAKQQNYRIVNLDLQLIDRSKFQDLDKFLRDFCINVSKQLELEPDFKDVLDDDYWDETGLSSKIKTTSYFDEYLLPKINLNQNLILAIDKLDLIFEYSELCKDFLSLLRAWYEKSQSSITWNKLHYIIIHSTDCYLPLDISQSPFNVGIPIILQGFSQEQVQELAKQYQLNLSQKQIDSLMNLVGGHPFLISLAFYHLAYRNTTLEMILETAPTEAGIYSDHLRTIMTKIEQEPEVIKSIKEIISAKEKVQFRSDLAFKLYGLGLVTLDGNKVGTSLNLYRQYLSERLPD